MMIRFTARTNEVAISGTRAELNQLATLLRGAEGGAIPTGDGPLGSYEKLLHGILIEDNPGASVVFSATNDDKLVIIGDSAKRHVPSKSVSDFANLAAESEHLHIDYYPEHFYLGPHSASTVISFKLN